MRYKYLELVRDALRAAREAVLTSLRSGRGGEYVGRGFFGDATIRADLEAEEAVLNIVRERIPDAYIVTEERGIKSGSGPLILVDPLDGSTNAKKGLLPYATTIAITREGGRRYKDIVAAGVMDHLRGEVYWGHRGAVYVDWRPARPSRIMILEESAISFHTQPQGLRDDELTRIAKLTGRVKYPRMFGSAALETVYVAIGRTEAHVASYRGLRSFDCLPSIFLVESSGGLVATIDEELYDYPLDTMNRLKFVVAANKRIMDEVLEGLGLTKGCRFTG